MLVTIEAQIAFGVWILLQVVLLFRIRKMVNEAGMVLSFLSTVFVGYLLYAQNWTIFFWYILIAGMITPFLRMMWKEEYREKLTIMKYVFTVLFMIVIDFVIYGIIYWLNI